MLQPPPPESAWLPLLSVWPSHPAPIPPTFQGPVPVSFLGPIHYFPPLCPSSLLGDLRLASCHSFVNTFGLIQHPLAQTKPEPIPSTLSTSPRPELILNPGPSHCGTNSPIPRVSLLVPPAPLRSYL